MRPRCEIVLSPPTLTVLFNVRFPLMWNVSVPVAVVPVRYCLIFSKSCCVIGRPSRT